MNGKPNRLIEEKSPYLLQHARNPVEWYPWREEVFEKAARENKPIFLSIGYSTCHWCHVMAHESFEDEEVSRLMNEIFVSIKVDREERPDIDGVYMTVCRMMTGSGGWPLTIIMTPDKKPFFAATYIPKESRFGRSGMLDLLPGIARLWKERREEIDRVAEEATAALRSSGTLRHAESLRNSGEGREGEELPDERLLSAARRGLYRTFDERFGGFGNAPKFPNVPHLLFLLGEWRRNGDVGALHMVVKTLEAMRLGGIHDHIGCGFHRYSTDQNWLVPHFEKMLYDQALLLMAYAEAHQATGSDAFRETALEIVSYVLGVLQSPEGGFHSAEDADSDGEEGRFYLWEMDEIEALLPSEELETARKLFGLESGGNYFDEALRDRSGLNIIHLKEPLEETARELRAAPGEILRAFRSIKKKLLVGREIRPRPHKDDKILTDWNGLMIAALAEAARVLGDGKSLDAAKRACGFILGRMRGERGGLFHRYREGETAFTGTLDDYAFLVWGLLELYESTFDETYLGPALELTDTIISRFWDAESGGFYLTADDAEEVLVRRKELYDGAIPSGNSVCLLLLARLGRMTGDPGLAEKAERLMRSWGDTVRRAPTGYTFFLHAADFIIGKGFEVVIVGEKGAPDTEKMVGELRKHYLPNKVLVLKEPGREGALPPRIERHFRGRARVNGRATCYICTSERCLPPVTEADEMLRALGLPP
jgi:uncharacterized protein YyaL (SSP411 family)